MPQQHLGDRDRLTARVPEDLKTLAFLTAEERGMDVSTFVTLLLAAELKRPDLAWNPGVTPRKPKPQRSTKKRGQVH